MRFPFLPLVPLLAASALPATAQDTAPPPVVTVDATVAVVSDYRLRGVSQSGLSPAIQGSVTVAHESGFYASAWASSVHGYVLADRRAAAEIDLGGGWKKTVGGTTFDVGALYYLYPHSHSTGDRTASGYIEPYADIAHTFGPLTAKVTANYAPKQKALALDQGASGLLAAQDSLYLAGDLAASVPATPFAVSAHIGHTFGPSWRATDMSGRSGYTDWNLGATWTHRILTIGISYLDTDARFRYASGRDVSRGGMLGSASVSF